MFEKIKDFLFYIYFKADDNHFIELVSLNILTVRIFVFIIFMMVNIFFLVCRKIVLFLTSTVFLCYILSCFLPVDCSG